MSNLLLSQPKFGQNEVVKTVTLPYTSTQKENFTEVKVEVPGVDPSTVVVEFEGDVLNVSCNRGVLSLPLALNTNTSKITANILWGMLTLTIPLPAPPATGKVKINVQDTLKKTPEEEVKKVQEEPIKASAEESVKKSPSKPLSKFISKD